MVSGYGHTLDPWISGSPSTLTFVALVVLRGVCIGVLLCVQAPQGGAIHNALHVVTKDPRMLTSMIHGVGIPTPSIHPMDEMEWYLVCHQILHEQLRCTLEYCVP